MGVCEAAGDAEEDAAALRVPPQPPLQGAPALLLRSRCSPYLARPRLGSAAPGTGCAMPACWPPRPLPVRWC